MVQMQKLSEPRGNLVLMLLLVPHIHGAGEDAIDDGLFWSKHKKSSKKHICSISETIDNM
jgi:hypothetical protein